MKNEELKTRAYLEKAKDSTVYYTVSGYFKMLERMGNYNNIPWNKRREGYSGVGLYATSICAERGIMVRSIPHEKFRKVNEYPECVLAEYLFGEGYPDLFPYYSPYLKDQFPNPPRG